MLFRGSWIADYPDAENFLACYYAPYLSPMGPNYTHFEDAQFDTLYRLIEAGESGQKASLRKQYIQQANQILIDQAPVIPLYYDKSIRLIQPWVQGLENDAANRLVLKRVKISR
jgi:peptide/nickel transport system substrate-binding protein